MSPEAGALADDTELQPDLLVAPAISSATRNFLAHRCSR
jgi:hypothetical protein